MKKRDLVKKLKKAGFVLEEHGARHDKYRRGNDYETIPRHNEINENTARDIIKRWKLK
ncbi:MAG: type II toxin-antitoxin system HicA family toxin [Lachnospiraceae bacterium]|nr:type II toxin-antitoxin system HicA family toxin [Lachnospiraceae bacterium]